MFRGNIRKLLWSSVFSARKRLGRQDAVFFCSRPSDSRCSSQPAAGEFTETRHQWQRNTLYSPFSGRSPKTLDPAVSYSSDETAYVYSIYEPPYQYHYLKRPYEVVPLTAVSLAAPRYFDKAGRELPQNADPSLIAESRYSIPIRSGIRFAPHPAFREDLGRETRLL